MKKSIAFLTMAFIFILLFIGWTTKAESEEDLFQYKNAYVGDNSAVINTLSQLKNNEHIKNITLKTNEKPYGIQIQYNDNIHSMDDMTKTAITNATYMFALIQNVDWISFHFAEEKLLIEKVVLEDWYDTDLSTFTNEEEVNQLLKTHKHDEDAILQLFTKETTPSAYDND